MGGILRISKAVDNAACFRRDFRTVHLTDNVPVAQKTEEQRTPHERHNIGAFKAQRREPVSHIPHEFEHGGENVVRLFGFAPSVILPESQT